MLGVGLQRMTKSIEEVKGFLYEVHKRLNKSKDNLYILRKKGKDKTNEFRIMYNISSEMVCGEVLKLDISNYSYTDYDDNPKWPNEEVWIFGQILSIPGVLSYEEMYIKLKIRNNVVCMSFHPKEFDLKYPYN